MEILGTYRITYPKYKVRQTKKQIKELVCDYMALSQTGVLPADSFFQEMCYKVCAHVGQSNNIAILDGILKMEVYKRFISKP